MIIFPRAYGDAREAGWTIDPNFLNSVRDTIAKIGIGESDDHVPGWETIESILLAAEHLRNAKLDRPHMHKPAYLLKDRGIVVVDKHSVTNAAEDDFKEVSLLLPLDIVARWSDEAQMMAEEDDDT